MKVTLDARMAFHTGIGRYIRQLVRSMLALDASIELVLWVPGDPGQPDWLEAPVGTRRFDAGIYTVREQILGSRLGREATGVCHFPHYNVPWRMPARSVVTVHDLTHLEFPGFFPAYRRWLARWTLGRAVRGAGRVIAVSEATRQALDRAFPGTAERTTVIHHGVDDVFRPLEEEEVARFRRAQGVDRPFLFVGSTRAHKNLGTLWRAFASLRQSDPGRELVCVLESPVTAPAEGIRVLSDLPDSELVRWYNVAEALVLPSLNEGFGMPALEAMACGTPVVASRIPAHEEVVADAGLLVGARDAFQLTASMTRLVTEPDLRSELAERGRGRAAEFRWSTAAERTLEIYRGLL